MTSSPVAMTAALQRNASLLPLPSATAPQTVEPTSSPRKRDDIAVEGQREEEERKEAERTTIASDDVARPRRGGGGGGRRTFAKKQNIGVGSACGFSKKCWCFGNYVLGLCGVIWCGVGGGRRTRSEEERK